MQRLDAIGTLPLGTDEATARAWIAAERARWGKVVKERGVKMDAPPAAPAAAAK